MPSAHTSDTCRRGQVVALIAVLVGFSCAALTAQAETTVPILFGLGPAAAHASVKSKKKTYRREGYAVWYVVPAGSLAKSRAGKGELTAAHNHLPLGTMVRVTHLANGQSVIVRITDRGITKRGATIDLCREAAEKLHMIREGMARVRLEELPDDKAAQAPPDSTSTVAHP